MAATSEDASLDTSAVLSSAESSAETPLISDIQSETLIDVPQSSEKDDKSGESSQWPVSDPVSLTPTSLWDISNDSSITATYKPVSSEKADSSIEEESLETPAVETADIDEHFSSATDISSSQTGFEKSGSETYFDSDTLSDDTQTESETISDSVASDHGSTQASSYPDGLMTSDIPSSETVSEYDASSTFESPFSKVSSSLGVSGQVSSEAAHSTFSEIASSDYQPLIESSIYLSIPESSILEASAESGLASADQKSGFPSGSEPSDAVSESHTPVSSASDYSSVAEESFIPEESSAPGVSSFPEVSSVPKVSSAPASDSESEYFSASDNVLDISSSDATTWESSEPVSSSFEEKPSSVTSYENEIASSLGDISTPVESSTSGESSILDGTSALDASSTEEHLSSNSATEQPLESEKAVEYSSKPAVPSSSDFPYDEASSSIEPEYLSGFSSAVQDSSAYDSSSVYESSLSYEFSSTPDFSSVPGHSSVSEYLSAEYSSATDSSVPEYSSVESSLPEYSSTSAHSTIAEYSSASDIYSTSESELYSLTSAYQSDPSDDVSFYSSAEYSEASQPSTSDFSSPAEASSSFSSAPEVSSEYLSAQLSVSDYASPSGEISRSSEYSEPASQSAPEPTSMAHESSSYSAESEYSEFVFSSVESASAWSAPEESYSESLYPKSSFLSHLQSDIDASSHASKTHDESSYETAQSSFDLSESSSTLVENSMTVSEEASESDVLSGFFSYESATVSSTFKPASSRLSQSYYSDQAYETSSELPLSSIFGGSESFTSSVASSDSYHSGSFDSKYQLVSRLDFESSAFESSAYPSQASSLHYAESLSQRGPSSASETSVFDALSEVLTSSDFIGSEILKTLGTSESSWVSQSAETSIFDSSSWSESHYASEPAHSLEVEESSLVPISSGEVSATTESSGQDGFSSSVSIETGVSSETSEYPSDSDSTLPSSEPGLSEVEDSSSFSTSIAGTPFTSTESSTAPSPSFDSELSVTGDDLSSDFASIGEPSSFFTSEAIPSSSLDVILEPTPSESSFSYEYSSTYVEGLSSWSLLDKSTSAAISQPAETASAESYETDDGFETLIAESLQTEDLSSIVPSESTTEAVSSSESDIAGSSQGSSGTGDESLFLSFESFEGSLTASALTSEPAVLESASETPLASSIHSDDSEERSASATSESGSTAHLSLWSTSSADPSEAESSAYSGAHGSSWIPDSSLAFSSLTVLSISVDPSSSALSESGSYQSSEAVVSEVSSTVDAVSDSSFGPESSDLSSDTPGPSSSYEGSIYSGVSTSNGFGSSAEETSVPESAAFQSSSYLLNFALSSIYQASSTSETEFQATSSDASFTTDYEQDLEEPGTLSEFTALETGAAESETGSSEPETIPADSSYSSRFESSATAIESGTGVPGSETSYYAQTGFPESLVSSAYYYSSSLTSTRDPEASDFVTSLVPSLTESPNNHSRTSTNASIIGESSVEDSATDISGGKSPVSGSSASLNETMSIDPSVTKALASYTVASSTESAELSSYVLGEATLSGEDRSTIADASQDYHTSETTSTFSSLSETKMSESEIPFTGTYTDEPLRSLYATYKSAAASESGELTSSQETLVTKASSGDLDSETLIASETREKSDTAVAESSTEDETVTSETVGLVETKTDAAETNTTSDVNNESSVETSDETITVKSEKLSSSIAGLKSTSTLTLDSTTDSSAHESTLVSDIPTATQTATSAALTTSSFSDSETEAETTESDHASETSTAENGTTTTFISMSLHTSTSVSGSMSSTVPITSSITTVIRVTTIDGSEVVSVTETVPCETDSEGAITASTTETYSTGPLDKSRSTGKDDQDGYKTSSTERASKSESTAIAATSFTSKDSLAAPYDTSKEAEKAEPIKPTSIAGVLFTSTNSDTTTKTIGSPDDKNFTGSAAPQSDIEYQSVAHEKAHQTTIDEEAYESDAPHLTAVTLQITSHTSESKLRASLVTSYTKLLQSSEVAAAPMEAGASNKSFKAFLIFPVLASILF